MVEIKKYDYYGQFIKFTAEGFGKMFKGVVVVNFIDNPIHIDAFSLDDTSKKIFYVHLSNSGVIADLTDPNAELYESMISDSLAVREAVMSHYRELEGL